MQPTTGCHVGTAIPIPLPNLFLQIESSEPSPIVGHDNLTGQRRYGHAFIHTRPSSNARWLVLRALHAALLPSNEQCDTARTERTVLTPYMYKVLAPNCGLRVPQQSSDWMEKCGAPRKKNLFR